MSEETPESAKPGDTWGAYKLDPDGWWRLNPIMSDPCSNCGEPIDANPRFEPDACLCSRCAEQMGCTMTGADKDQEMYIIEPPSREQIKDLIAKDMANKKPYTLEELSNSKPSELELARREFRESIVKLTHNDP